VAALAGLLLVWFGSGCDSTPAAVEDDSGLRPGTFDMVFAVPDALFLPEPLKGQHNLTFRVAAPATSADDVTLVSSRLTPPEGPVQNDYLELAREELIIDETRWALRFRYVQGPYLVSFTVRDAGFGNLRIPVGCVVRPLEGPSFVASGCRLDRR
jgi:hypothetical protein